METIELSLEKTLSIWWSFMWRSVLGTMLVGFVLGLIGRFIVGFAGSPHLGSTVGAILGWMGSIPVSIWALKAALNKKHGGCSISLSQSA